MLTADCFPVQYLWLKELCEYFWNQLTHLKSSLVYFFLYSVCYVSSWILPVSFSYYTWDYMCNRSQSTLVKNFDASWKCKLPCVISKKTSHCKRRMRCVRPSSDLYSETAYTLSYYIENETIVSSLGLYYFSRNFSTVRWCLILFYSSFCLIL